MIRVSHFNAPLMMLVCYDVETAWRNPGDQWYENYCSGEQDATIVATTMMFAMGYPSDKTKPSPWHFQRKPIEDTVTKL